MNFPLEKVFSFCSIKEWILLRKICKKFFLLQDNGFWKQQITKDGLVSLDKHVDNWKKKYIRCVKATKKTRKTIQYPKVTFVLPVNENIDIYQEIHKRGIYVPETRKKISCISGT